MEDDECGGFDAENALEPRGPGATGQPIIMDVGDSRRLNNGRNSDNADDYNNAWEAWLRAVLADGGVVEKRQRRRYA